MSHGFALIHGRPEDGERNCIYVRHAADGAYVLEIYDDNFFLRAELSVVRPGGERVEIDRDERILAALSKRGGYESIMTYEEAADAILAWAGSRVPTVA